MCLSHIEFTLVRLRSAISRFSGWWRHIHCLSRPKYVSASGRDTHTNMNTHTTYMQRQLQTYICPYGNLTAKVVFVVQNVALELTCDIIWHPWLAKTGSQGRKPQSIMPFASNSDSDIQSKGQLAIVKKCTACACRVHYT